MKIQPSLMYWFMFVALIVCVFMYVFIACEHIGIIVLVLPCLETTDEAFG